MTWSYKLKLPPLSEFVSYNKGQPPYGLLVEWIQKQVPKSDFDRIRTISNVVINPFDYKVLSKFVEDWYKKAYPRSAKKMRERDLGWYNLENSPAEAEEVTPGFVYIRLEESE